MAPPPPLRAILNYFPSDHQLSSPSVPVLITSLLSSCQIHHIPNSHLYSSPCCSSMADMAVPSPSQASLSSPGMAMAGSSEMTPLQKHVSFFDRNKDGLVYPWETYQGFRAIGAGIALSTVSALLINGFLAPQTRPGKLPSLLFPIYVCNIHRAKHGSDSGVYDAEGRFVPEKFEEIFQKHAHTNPNALTSDELMEMLKANREPKDYKGWFAAKKEWKILYRLCKDKDGLLSKETIKALYDGSLFFKMAEERASQQKRI